MTLRPISSSLTQGERAQLTQSPELNPHFFTLGIVTDETVSVGQAEPRMGRESPGCGGPDPCPHGA